MIWYHKLYLVRILSMRKSTSYLSGHFGFLFIRVIKLNSSRCCVALSFKNPLPKCSNNDSWWSISNINHELSEMLPISYSKRRISIVPYIHTTKKIFLGYLRNYFYFIFLLLKTMKPFNPFSHNTAMHWRQCVPSAAPSLLTQWVSVDPCTDYSNRLSESHPRPPSCQIFSAPASSSGSW